MTTMDISELRKRVEHLRRVGPGYVSLEFWRDLAKEAIVVAQDLLATVEAKPVAGGVPDEPGESENLSNKLGIDLKPLNDHVHHYGTMEARIALMALLDRLEEKDKVRTDAKPVHGWVEGAPDRRGKYVCEYKNGNILYGDFQDPESWDCRIPERIPPKREPVVDCCSFGRDNIKLVNGQWDMIITVEHPGGNLKTYSLTPTRCICDTELPELNQGE